MKCPEQFRILQQTIRKPIIDTDNIARGEYHILIENQAFCECYQEKCAAWDKEKQCCRKVGQ